MRVLFLSLLLAGVAVADEEPQVVGTGPGGCTTVIMCNAQSAAGDCDDDSDATGDEYVVQIGGSAKLNFYSTQSTATACSVDLVSNDQGHDAASGSGNIDVAGVVTCSTDDQHTTVGGTWDYVWINVPSLSGGNVTVTMGICPL